MQLQSFGGFLSGHAVVAACLFLAIPGEFLAIPLDWLGGERGGLVSRNLVVRETNLVGTWPTQAEIDQFGEDLAWQNFGAPPIGAKLEGADLRGASLWHATVDPNPDPYRFSDLRGLDLELPTAEDWGDWSESAEALSHDKGRERLLFVWRELDAAAQEEQKGGTPGRPEFPSSLSEMEDVLFKQAPLFDAFDPKLADFLIGLACSHDAPPSIAHNIAQRAVDEREDGRLYPRLVAQALLGDDCAPANDLPDALHKKLDELAVRRDTRQ